MTKSHLSLIHSLAVAGLLVAPAWATYPSTLTYRSPTFARPQYGPCYSYPQSTITFRSPTFRYSDYGYLPYRSRLSDYSSPSVNPGWSGYSRSAYSSPRGLDASRHLYAPVYRGYSTHTAH